MTNYQIENSNECRSSPEQCCFPLFSNIILCVVSSPVSSCAVCRGRLSQSQKFYNTKQTNEISGKSDEILGLKSFPLKWQYGHTWLFSLFKRLIIRNTFSCERLVLQILGFLTYENGMNHKILNKRLIHEPSTMIHFDSVVLFSWN